MAKSIQTLPTQWNMPIYFLEGKSFDSVCSEGNSSILWNVGDESHPGSVYSAGYLSKLRKTGFISKIDTGSLQRKIRNP